MWLSNVHYILGQSSKPLHSEMSGPLGLNLTGNVQVQTLYLGTEWYMSVRTESKGGGETAWNEGDGGLKLQQKGGMKHSESEWRTWSKGNGTYRRNVLYREVNVLIKCHYTLYGNRSLVGSIMGWKKSEVCRGSSCPIQNINLVHA